MAMKCALGEFPDQFWQLLSKSIASTKIFVINTQSHGAGSDYAIMRDIVKYLHSQHGFSVLCMASGFYDGLKIKENQQPLHERIQGSLFRMYANSEELVELFDYIESYDGSENELYLAGVDVPMGGFYSKQYLIAELIGYLDLHDIDHFVLSDFFKLCQSYLSLEPVDHVDRQQIMHNGFAYLEKTFADHHFQTTDFWLLMLENLKSRYVFTEFGESRDLQMANNFKYIYELLQKNKKIILWGHACHGLPMEDNLGGWIKSWYGDDVYICHLTSHDGSIVNFETGANTVIPAAPHGFIEAQLSSLGLDVALITGVPPTADCIAQQINLSDETQIRLLAYSSSCPLNRVFSNADERGLIDAIVFTNKIIPSNQIWR